jgi:hydrogenase nickel incorporation protein HypA/HybF
LLRIEIGLIMHELSLAQSLIELIEEESQRQAFMRVRKIWLEVGALAGVEPEALRFGLEVATQKTCAEGAELDMSILPGSAWCFDCEKTIEIQALYDGCPHCNSHRLQVTGGDQMKLKQLEVE